MFIKILATILFAWLLWVLGPYVLVWALARPGWAVVVAFIALLIYVNWRGYHRARNQEVK